MLVICFLYLFQISFSTCFKLFVKNFSRTIFSGVLATLPKTLGNILLFHIGTLYFFILIFLTQLTYNSKFPFSYSFLKSL